MCFVGRLGDRKTAQKRCKGVWGKEVFWRDEGDCDERGVAEILKDSSGAPMRVGGGECKLNIEAV